MMRFTLAAASLAILAALSAGCTSRGPENRPVAVTPIEQPYRAGTGVVQAVSPAPAAIAAGAESSASGAASASASPTAAPTSGMQRLRIRMDDGRMMYVDTPSREIATGQRVLLTEAKEIRVQ